jgi:hypothetical protein
MWWQDRLTPVWKRLGGGCSILQDRIYLIDDVIEAWREQSA